MTVPQRVIRLVVIEFRLVEGDDQCITPFVVGMTLVAFLAGFQTSVEPAFLGNILADVLMTKGT